jgi:hypothetical protein
LKRENKAEIGSDWKAEKRKKRRRQPFDRPFELHFDLCFNKALWGVGALAEGRRQRAARIAVIAVIAGIADIARDRKSKDLSPVDRHRGIREVNPGVESAKSLFLGVE